MNSEKPKTKRQLQAETMRYTLQSIVERFARDTPLDKIKIQDICSEAGVSLGNFYQYFQSKEEAMIYSYQYIDRKWQEQHFENIQDPLERVKIILKTHLESMADATLCFLAQLYISQLKVYDEYFFTQDRYLHKVLREAIKQCQESGKMVQSYTDIQLAIKLVNFSRGLVYNYCIQHKEDQKAWLEFAIHESTEYLSLFLTEKD
ncbi:MAG: TetR/AcrR family transcriptional regulator [Treponema sp.]|nr:TetR/AcrR family transcriptional regulator [Treponema sp.]